MRHLGHESPLTGESAKQLLPFTEENEGIPCRVDEEAQVCDIVVTESGLRTTSATALVDGGHLDLKCRLLPVSEKTFATSNPSTLTLEVAESERLFVVDFTPDIILPDPAPELFCAEILRMGNPLLYSNEKVPSRSTHGIFLRRIHGATLDCGERARYERVGRFWMVLKSIKSSEADDGPFGHVSMESIRII